MDADPGCFNTRPQPTERRRRLAAGRGVGLWAAAVCAALPAGCDPAAGESAPRVIHVLAAASTTDVIGEIARAFERRHPGTRVDICTGSSNGLAQQILAGAPADVFLSANRQWADAVADHGLASDTVDLLGNQLVLIVPEGNPAGIATIHDLNRTGVTRVAIADDQVPAGIYAQQTLQRFGQFDALQQSNRLARGSSVRVTLTYVERAEAEAGIVYATDAAASRHVVVVAQLDPQTHDPVVYPAVLLRQAADNATARAFFGFLQTGPARTLFRGYGFSPLGRPAAGRGP